MTEQDQRSPQLAAKRCSKCKTIRPLDMFPPDRRRRSGLASDCHVCRRVTTRIHRLGLDPAVAATQYPDDGACEICGVEPPNHGLHLDHDHETGAFRGWLCRSCNTAVGLAGDDPARLRAMADYLDRKNRQ